MKLLNWICSLRKRHSWSHATRIAPTIVIAGLLFAVSNANGASRTADTASGTKVYHNAHWVELSDGTKALDVRWAVGNPIKVTTLRIPKAYLGPLMGENLCHPFSPTEVDPDCRQNFSLGMLLRGVLPDFRAPDFPLMEDRPDLADIQIFSTARVPDKDPNLILREELSFRLEMVRATSSRVRDLAPIFGLEGKGTAPTPDLVNKNPQDSPDIYYNAQSPEKATVFLACMDDEVSRIVSKYLVTGDKAFCEESFYVPEIKAIAAVQFRRPYLKNWEEIRTKLDLLLSGFRQSE
ncbi:MAG TPA: hypothetical protein VIL84_00725 [Devosiaceae bacterium]